MAAERVPKDVINLVDKPEVARQWHVVKEGNDGRLTGKRLPGASSKISCKTSGGAGVVKDGRDQLRGAQSENKTRDRSQSKTQTIITNFLTYGDQGKLRRALSPSLRMSQTLWRRLWGVYHDEKGSEAGKGLLESGPDLDISHDYVEGQGDRIKNLEQQVICATLHIIREQEERTKVTCNLIKECPEIQQEKGIEWQKERNTVGEDVVKDWTFETLKVENDGKNSDWSKDGGDEFYSLTEKSEAVSSGCDVSEEDGNASSMAESLSSVVGPTVRPQRWQRKRINSRIGAGVIGDSPGECAEMLKWGYSGIRLSQPGKESKVPKDSILFPTQPMARTSRMGRQIK
ncbi:hypothetical protein NDU88_003512 [Pleurodeles waltl]|uniref:Uncharacterized protein n=1 Tax=Pleurodeles waltl TaxID=8319 RepID=A0AAV7SDP3_PLEWA|nr:hypothetical protein NDU88_003512 [Pleurodeles waltl]